MGSMNYEENIFTKIINKQIPCKAIYEDENILSFYDINPRAKIHALVIPKINVINFSDFCEKGDLNEFFKKVKFIAEDVLKLTDYKILTNNGKNAGQEVFHFHLHIMAN